MTRGWQQAPEESRAGLGSNPSSATGCMGVQAENSAVSSPVSSTTSLVSESVHRAQIAGVREGGETNSHGPLRAWHRVTQRVAAEAPQSRTCTL